MDPLRVLVVCTGNSIRSQMAEAFLQQEGGDRLQVSSAGTHPSAVHPLTIRALAEVGIDWTGARSKGLGDVLGEPIDLAVTVCDDASARCPVIPGARRQIHRAFRDPVGARGSELERMREFRAVRDEIRGWARELAEQLLGGTSGPAP